MSEQEEKEAELEVERQRRKAYMDFELQNRGDKLKTDDRSERPSVSCYGCGKPSITKPRCQNCKKPANKDSANFSNISLHSYYSNPNQSVVLKLDVKSTWRTTCADSRASVTFVGEVSYLLLRRERVNFQKTRLFTSLADGPKSEVEVYTTSVLTRLEGHVIRTPLIALSYAKGNQTLLEMDFLQKAGIVLNLKHCNWFFIDLIHRTCDFVNEVIIKMSKADLILRKIHAYLLMRKVNV
ncbi:retrovirus-related Pol polyprotein from transposon 297 [Nephila pilipes]|uniref:Retrovirus-related Pol polyprotein from transposon 297 n=1 Tax=Nephila pilipes TaxID=299642 RepID=A0A8X6IX57_NEPPI|nr:retrovirus-related Pol polyprotein from transposon 297 [Nephila pilipes]